MINSSHALPIVRQCQLLDIARSTAYYRPQALMGCQKKIATQILQKGG